VRGATSSDGSGPDLDGHGDETVRRHHLFDQVAQGKPGHNEVVLLTATGELGQNLPAALGLSPQQHHVVVMRVGGLGVAHQLFGHNGDGRERGAEPVRRSGG
jgi:hypothetical protein